ncbi:mitochondrial fission ELM1 family protein [Pseudomonadota bacterium]
MNNPTGNEPRVWLVIGDKLGDNAQATMIADSLGLAYDTRKLVPKSRYIRGKPRFKVSLDHLDLSHSDTLEPPWPDLVITVGRRHAMAALWIKQQHPRTRIVLLGRPRRWIEKFDLIIVPPQHSVPHAPNVMQLTLPLLRVDQHAVSSAAEKHMDEFAGLAKPIIAVLVGGPTRPFRFDERVAVQLMDCCKQIQRELGGSLYISTSRRTPAEVCTALKQNLPDQAMLHTWEGDDQNNPYLALLGVADYFVVTGDSVSMLIEVADCGKPLAIFPLPFIPGSRLWQRISQRLHMYQGDGLLDRSIRMAGQLLYQSGLVGYTRDLTRLHTSLIESGYAVKAGKPFKQPAGTLPNTENQVRARILSLLRKPD